MRGTHIGEFEELVLLIVSILSEDAYVLKIRDELNEQVGRSVSMGALHSTLSRLEAKECLTSDLKPGSNKRGGRKKRVYEPTAFGSRVLTEVKETRNRLWQQIPGLKVQTGNG